MKSDVISKKSYPECRFGHIFVKNAIFLVVGGVLAHFCQGLHYVVLCYMAAHVPASSKNTHDSR